MSKLETFDQKTTTWTGLWYHPETLGYTSAALDLSKLKQFKGAVRLYVRKNRFYSGGKNGRPNYVFCIRDAKCECPCDIDIVDTEQTAEWEWNEFIDGLTVYEGYECSKCNYANGYKKTKFCPDCGAMMLNGE